MLLRIKKLQLLTGCIVIICTLLTNVESQLRLVDSCITCDSAIAGEEDCGFVKESENGLNVKSCDPALGCFTEIYETNINDRSGWYTRRGCFKELTSCTDPLTCDTCDSSNNCNRDIFPSDRQTCLKCTNSDCSSPKNEYCSIHLKDSNGCATLFDEDGSVVLKSCYADLVDSTRSLCDDLTYLDCKKCEGRSCNAETQREGTKCHRCSGADCLIIDTQSTLVDCRSQCFIGVDVNGKTIRGCASDFPNANLCSTDESSTAGCFVCDGDSCNSIIYPLTGRLQCHTCVDGDCEPTDENLEYCSRFGTDERCASIFDDSSDEVVARSCLSSLETQQRETCEANSTNCIKCAYNKCNKDETKLKTDLCIGCNSKDEANCLKASSIFETRCSTNECFSRLMEPEDAYLGQHMERGCLADLLLGTECNSPDCMSCAGSNCNSKLFPVNRISCKSCERETCNGGSVDKICNHFIDNEACITFYGQDSEVIYRDCYADAPEGTRDLCDDSSSLDCTKCEGNLCNVDNERRGNKCYQCEGTECFTPGLSDVIDCMSDCYVGINIDGEPLRDCADEVTNSNYCGSSELTCLTCTGDLCNGLTFPTQDRLICVKCLGEDCERLNTISEYCERWHPDERCVTVFDDADSVIERGCSSTIQNAPTCSSGNLLCLSCDFDECNIEVTSAEKYHCVSCNSKENSKCVSNPLGAEVVGCRISQCYSRLLTSDGIGQHIERGCITSVQQCSGTSCISCEGERCNSNDFPADRHSCYYCSGDHCALGPLQEKQCTIYNQQNKDCITIYGDENDVIYRNCYVDSVEGTRNVCDDENDLTCSTCSGKLCNNDTSRRGTKCLKCGISCFDVEDLSSAVDCPTGGCYVGINSKGETIRDCATAAVNTESCVKNDTQSGTCLVCEEDYCNSITYPVEGRLICKECLYEACEENLLEDKYCEKFQQGEQCVSVFDDSNKILERGCLSTVQQSVTCSGLDANCLKCSFNRCNTQNSKQEIYHCVGCNSKGDPNCVTNSTSVATKTCKTNQCYSRLLPQSSGSVWNYVEKGCVADLQNVNTCTGSNCLACVGDRCNNILYPSDRLSCLDCRNGECKAETISTKFCRLFNRQRQACVTLYSNENEVIYRGCYGDAAEGTKEVCDDSSQLLCTKCSTRNCNSDTSRRGHKCFKCSGVQCFKPDYPADTVDCLSNCYLGVNEQGETVRGCASSFTNTTACGTDDDGINRCHVCADDLCNGIQFPLANRLECHTCSEEGCKAGEDNLEYCERYQGQERCVTVFSENDQVVERGCSSSLLSQHYCDQNYANCFQCPSRGCNTIDSKINRLCAVCNSSQDRKCVANATMSNSKYCKQGCFTRVVNEVLTRGCLEDLDESIDCVPDHGCKFCNEIDKCNIEVFPDDRRVCRTCDSLESCQTPELRHCNSYRQNDSCVTIFNRYQVSIKGCLSDQTANNQIVCGSTSNMLCTSCSSQNNCNIEMVRRDENCVFCSSALNPDCAQRPTYLSTEHCSVSSNGQCFTRIMNGATVRGCKGQLSSTELSQCNGNTPSSQCTITTGQGSNNKILPANRRKCFQCDSRIDPSCADVQTNKTLTLPCKKFFEPETCITLKTSDGYTVRGCLADFSSDICTQEKCIDNCQKDNDSNEDGCNKSHASMIHINIFCLVIMLFFITFKSS